MRLVTQTALGVFALDQATKIWCFGAKDTPSGVEFEIVPMQTGLTFEARFEFGDGGHLVRA